MSDEMAGVAQKWLSMLGIKSRVFLATKADVSSVAAIDKYNLRGPFSAIRSAGTQNEADGGKRTLPNGDHYIILPKSARKSHALEALAHEIGHILESDEWSGADRATKDAVMADYQKWLDTAGNTKAADWVKQLRAHTSGKLTRVATSETADRLPPYWRSFGEYFADQVSRWATTSDKPLTAVDTFFKRIALAMRRLYAMAAGKPYLPGPAMKAYLDARGESSPLPISSEPTAEGSKYAENTAWIGANVSFIDTTFNGEQKKRSGVVLKASNGTASVSTSTGIYQAKVSGLSRTSGNAVPIKGHVASDDAPGRVKALDFARDEFLHGSPHWYVAATLRDDVLGNNSKLGSEAYAYLYKADNAQIWDVINSVAKSLGSKASSNADVRTAVSEIVAERNDNAKPTAEAAPAKAKAPESQAFEARTLSDLRAENGTQGAWIGDLMKDGVAYPVRMNFKRENRADWWADIYDGGKVNTSIPFGWIKGSITVNDAIDAVLRYVKEDKSASWSFANAGKKHGALLEKKAAAKQRSESAKVRSYDKQIASIGGKPGADWAETDRRLASELESLESIRYKTGANEQLISILKGRIASDPSKFQAGYGVGWRVTRDQINRGYQVVFVSNVEKTATIRQVADTGLTTSGGNNDRMQDTEVYVSDLIRDRRYDRPAVAENKQTSAPAKAPEAKGGEADTATMPAQDGVGNQSGQATITPSDSAIYDMAREGKSAQEILEFIGASARRPFDRYLAKALMNLGVKSTIKLDMFSGWKISQALPGKRYAAAYSPKTDTVAIFTPRGATQSILHELVHAATLKALANPRSRAAIEMRRLFKHVQDNGQADGMYGMRNVDEFVAEAFSNPKFQQALMSIPAPRGSSLKSAWEWFVGVVARMLGMRRPAQATALDRAMVLGAAVMNENAAIAGNATGGNRYAIAHHGTPHVLAPEPGFPHGRFRLDKIGTGEGAQVYGWGVYFAENEGVAGTYQKQNTFRAFDLSAESAKLGFALNAAARGEVVRQASTDKPSDLAAVAVQRANIAARDVDSAKLANLIAGYRAAKEGSIYRLDIPDDVMPKLLDWDKPLREQQPEVMAAIQKAAEVRAKQTGSAFAPLSMALLGKDIVPTIGEGRLREAGIPGLRYLDGDSRSDGAGTHNYVIWDQKTLDRIALLERNGEALDDIRFREADDGNVSGNVGGDISDTITIDGVERPRMNSNGKPIAQTDEALRKFYAWFGDSAVTDEKGRPLVMYHGTHGFDIKSFCSARPRKRRKHYLTGGGQSNNKLLQVHELGPEAAFFSPNQKYAESYASEQSGIMQPGI
ncbi:MAG: hypothetical protein IPM03_02505 [Sulfuritalea sp.]|nr:hypothetical protein [Sulfuritalea sp.]